MTYDAILFDCDGVLVELPDRAAMVGAMERVQDRIGVPGGPEQVVKDFVRGDLASITERCRDAGIDREAFCATAARESIRAQLAEFRSGLRTVYDDIAAVERLEKPLGLVSDNHPRVLSVLQQQFDLDCFQTVHGCRFTPAGLERRKPAPDNVDTAMDALGAETAVYVGDRAVDVRAAENAGIDSVLLERAGWSDRDVDVGPTYELSTLRDLPDLL